MITNGYQAFALVFILAAPAGIFVAWLEEKITHNGENGIKARREIEVLLYRDKSFFNLMK